MRTIEIKLYTFNELSEDAQKKAILEYANNNNLEEFVLCDGIESLKAYCDHFGVTLERYQIGAYCPSYGYTDANNAHFRGLKLKSCDRDLMPTGYCMDSYFFESFYDEFKRTGNALEAFNTGLHEGINAIERDCEACHEEDYITDMLENNDYEFLETGEIYN